MSGRIEPTMSSGEAILTELSFLQMMRTTLVRTCFLLLAAGVFGGRSEGALIAGSVDPSDPSSGSVELLGVTYSVFGVDSRSSFSYDQYSTRIIGAGDQIVSSSSFLRGDFSDVSGLSEIQSSNVTLEYYRNVNGSSFLYGRDRFMSGAVLGDDNYLLLDLNNSGTFETVARFEFVNRGMEILGIVSSDNDSALDLSSGLTSIEAVPEPSSFLLVVLAGVGFAFRRSR